MPRNAIEQTNLDPASHSQYTTFKYHYDMSVVMYYNNGMLYHYLLTVIFLKTVRNFN